jgi:HlyD family secretion protein
MRKIRHNIARSRVLIIGCGLLVAVLVALVIGLCRKPHQPTIQGQVETTDYRVSTKVPSRVVKLLVKEGDEVHKGDTLAILSSPELNASEAGAVAGKEATQALQEMTDEGSRREAIASALDVWRQAQAHEEIARKTWARMENLCHEGVMSQQKGDEAKSAYDAAHAATLAAHQHYLMVLDGARRQEKEAMAYKVKQGEAQVEKVRSMLKETVLTAAMSGHVTEVFLEEGELAGMGAPIMNIDTDEYWFTFYITEDKLPGIELGKTVHIRVPSTGQTVEARVSRINNEGNFAAWKATRALDDVDLKVFEVRAYPLQPLRKALEGASAILASDQ